MRLFSRWLMAHMTESQLFKRLKACTPGFDWQRHEDKLTKGIPDCDYGVDGRGGWVELKTYNNWPKNADEALSWSDLKPEQVNWIAKRGRVQRSVYFLLQVGDDCLLLSWRYVRQFGTLTKDELIARADAHCVGKMTSDFAKVLRRRHGNRTQRG